ncbi:LysM peptidoglycan-binding domain-containing protein [Phycicoccus sonneratiae]|uniref:LysM peptidoglycan-binding domain-containing protein n=1 Tax=Phycicoccus sonneratiae TaxID=2807628 RepID=A0ABS2CLZ5_9MICO|nr:LysM peptidoglycan-binding domain-containing protein [Phycicoccus sonneraticus]MBM6400912.1 LysM peptidoglycan-binding domain-containing protein [Phycicoccus sonneraticus]
MFLRFIVSLATLVAAGGCAAGLSVVLGSTLAAALRGAPVEAADVLLALVAALGLLGLAWLALGVLLEALARVPGVVGRFARRASAALSPFVVRRVAAVVLGVGVGATGVGAGGAVAAPARAVGTVVAGALAPSAGPPVVLAAADPLPDPGWRVEPDPGWTPRAPAVRPQPDVSVVSGRGPAARDADGVVVVHRGDTLWSVAARHLGPGASDAEIAEQWPLWYAANRDVVGPDPDLLLPGQVLRAPSAVVS